METDPPGERTELSPVVFFSFPEPRLSPFWKGCVVEWLTLSKGGDIESKALKGTAHRRRRADPLKNRQGRPSGP